jgi:hypothetical protein
VPLHAVRYDSPDIEIEETENPATAVSFMMPKLYAITVISSLNSRQSEQERDRTMTHLESGHGIRTRTGNVLGDRVSTLIDLCFDVCCVF